MKKIREVILPAGIRDALLKMLGSSAFANKVYFAGSMDKSRLLSEMESDCCPDQEEENIQEKSTPVAAPPTTIETVVEIAPAAIPEVIDAITDIVESIITSSVNEAAEPEVEAAVEEEEVETPPPEEADSTLEASLEESNNEHANMLKEEEELKELIRQYKAQGKPLPKSLASRIARYEEIRAQWLEKARRVAELMGRQATMTPENVLARNKMMEDMLRARMEWLEKKEKKVGDFVKYFNQLTPPQLSPEQQALPSFAKKNTNTVKPGALPLLRRTPSLKIIMNATTVGNTSGKN